MTPDDTAVFGQIALVVVLSLGALSGIGVAVHYYVQRSKQRMFGQAPQRSLDDEERMLRLEQAVDSIAVEVERISEGQRFLTKLQTEQRTERGMLGK
jgi:hypothetical protein